MEDRVRLWRAVRKSAAECSPGKRDPKFVALANRFVRLIDDEIRRIGDKIPHPNHFAVHASFDSDRAMRLAAFLQVALMIFFRAPECGYGFDLRHDRAAKAPTLIDLFL